MLSSPERSHIESTYDQAAYCEGFPAHNLSALNGFSVIIIFLSSHYDQ